MDICTIADRRYFRFYATLLASIARSNPARHFTFHLIWEGADAADIALFEAFRAANNLTVNFIEVDGSQIKRVYDLGKGGHVSHHTYYRLLIPELLPTASTALYLDVDIVVVSALDELLRTDLSGVGAAVVREPADGRSVEAFGVAKDLYFNTGVMLMNLAYWREHQIGEKALRFATEHPDVLEWWDQCALNVALLGQVTYLDPRWNCTLGSAKRYASLAPAVIHFTGRRKPWDEPARQPYGIHYANYSQLTPWPVDYFRDSKRQAASTLGRVLRSVKRALRR